MNNILLLYVTLFVFLVSFLRDGYAGSTFVPKSSHLQVYGCNYDWDLDDAPVIVNKRGCVKRNADRPGEKGEKAIWTAKYGSVTFNQYGREFPMGGMNEVGLVVEAMALSDTCYPEPDGRPYMGSASQWKQYLLDTCASVAEVVAGDRKVRISNKSMGPGTHVLVLDQSGASAACPKLIFLQ